MEQELPPIEVSEHLLSPPYANYVHMVWNPQEVILTFCLQTTMPSQETVRGVAPNRAVAVQRVVLGRGTALALLKLLLSKLVDKAEAQAIVQEVHE